MVPGHQGSAAHKIPNHLPSLCSTFFLFLSHNWLFRISNSVVMKTNKFGYFKTPELFAALESKQSLNLDSDLDRDSGWETCLGTGKSEHFIKTNKYRAYEK